MKKLRLLTIALMLVAIASSAARAEEVRLRITGFIPPGSDPGGVVGEGEPFQADVVYDTANFVDGFKYFPAQITFVIGAYTVTTGNGAINVEPDVIMPGDSYQIVDDGFPWTGQIAGREVLGIALNFQGHDADELDDFVSTAPYVLDLTEWEVANGTVDLDPVVEGPEIGLDVVTFELAPTDPAELIAGLVGDVIALNLQGGITNSLDAKLDSALNALEDLNSNNDVAAVNSLQAFINAVQAQRGKKIPVADADALIASAQAIIDLINGN